MKNKLFASVPNILFGALITIAPQTFAHACTGHDMPGACHYSQQAATGIGVVILVFGVVDFDSSAPQIRIGLNIAAAADALLLLAVPTFLIGICKGARCTVAWLCCPRSSCSACSPSCSRPSPSGSTLAPPKRN